MAAKNCSVALALIRKNLNMVCGITNNRWDCSNNYNKIDRWNCTTSNKITENISQFRFSDLTAFLISKYLLKSVCSRRDNNLCKYYANLNFTKIAHHCVLAAAYASSACVAAAHFERAAQFYVTRALVARLPNIPSFPQVPL